METTQERMIPRADETIARTNAQTQAREGSVDDSKLHVIVIGGGIGGLCLAQGLKKAGIAFTVFERDPAPTSRLQGYRLSMTPDGFEAIRKNLSDELWQRIESATAPFTGGMAMVSEQLEELMFIKTPKPESAVRRFGSISRIALREILLTGLGENVQFGKRFSRYDILDDQSLRCFFDDGSFTHGTLLVGADGVNSQVRAQFMPSAERIKTGVCAISAKVPFDEITKRDYLQPPISDSVVIVDHKPQGMFLARHELDGDEGAYVFWSVGSSCTHFPANVDSLSPAELMRLADQMTDGWHPRLKNMIRRADPDSVLLLRFNTSPRVERWPPGRVTLMGDAIHSMPPSGGLGANTALMDAAVLCEALHEFKAGRCDLVGSVGAYETRMFKYAFPAVAESMSNLRRMTNENLLTRRLGRAGMKVAGKLLGMRGPTPLEV
jgi:salicylate hydroxylase